MFASCSSRSNRSNASRYGQHGNHGNCHVVFIRWQLPLTLWPQFTCSKIQSGVLCQIFCCVCSSESWLVTGRCMLYIVLCAVTSVLQHCTLYTRGTYPTWGVLGCWLIHCVYQWPTDLQLIDNKTYIGTSYTTGKSGQILPWSGQCLLLLCCYLPAVYMYMYNHV